MDLQINKDNTVKLPTAINNSEVAIDVKEVREVVKGILSAELKVQTLTPRIFNIFKTVIHDHNVEEFAKLQKALANASGFKNIAQLSEASGTKTIQTMVSTLKRYTKEFTGKPESFGEIQKELKAVSQAKNSTPANGKDGKTPDSTIESGTESEAPSAIPSSIVDPHIIEFINKAPRLSVEQQREIGKVLAQINSQIK